MEQNKPEIKVTKYAKNYSIRKGKLFELKVAQFLASIFKISFLRIPNSGAYVGGINKGRIGKTLDENSQIIISEGDILVPDKFKFMKFECKFYNKINYGGFLTENKEFDGWIEQAKGITNRIWFLCAKANYQDEIVAFDKRLLCIETSDKNRIKLGNYIDYKKKYIITSLIDFFYKNKDFFEKLSSDLDGNFIDLEHYKISNTLYTGVSTNKPKISESSFDPTKIKISFSNIRSSNFQLDNDYGLVTGRINND